MEAETQKQSIPHGPLDSAFSSLSIQSTETPCKGNETVAALISKESSPFSEIRAVSHHANPPTYQPFTPSSSPSPFPSSSTAIPPSPASSTQSRSSPFQFGTRYLTSTSNIYTHNAWDHVDSSADPSFVAYAQKQYAFQREHAASEWDQRRFEAEPGKWWDRFYGNNHEKFFKDRKWLRQEFEALRWVTRNWDVSRDEKEIGDVDGEVEADGEVVREERIRYEAARMAKDQVDFVSAIASPALTDVGQATSEANISQCSNETTTYKAPSPGPWDTLLEIGAGAGNTAFPLLRANHNPSLKVHAVDFSPRAVKLMLSSPLFDSQHMSASTWDMAASSLPENLTPNSVDVVVLVFAFSALSPKQWSQAVKNVWKLLRPGGEICFRDYGRGDLAQVRFRKGRWLGENFYVRGDGTRVYFFDEEELRGIWGGAVGQMATMALREHRPEGGEGEMPAADWRKENVKGAGKHEEYIIDGTDDAQPESVRGTGAIEEPASPAFEILSLATDRRLLVNRKSQLKMYRCWMQGRFRKPLDV